jgi:signal transduction histidine kinase
MGSNVTVFTEAGWFPKDLKTLRNAFFVAGAYYLGALAAFAVGTLSDQIFAPFWPPNIVLFCTLLLVPKQQWWLYILATFPAHVIAEVSVGMPPLQLLVAFATNCLVAILCAVGVRWFLKEPPWFGTLGHASIYLLITAGVAPAIAAFGGAFVQLLAEGQTISYWSAWANWYMANALGAITLGPVFLSWFGENGRAEPLNRPRMIEAVILAVSLGIVCTLVFRAEAAIVGMGFLPSLLYSPLPFILWAAIRFGKRGSSGAILVVTVVSIWQNLNESTLFVDTPENNVFALQVFLIGVAVPLFFLGAAIDELRRTGEKTRELTGALLRAQDEERRRIARDLHDSTGQNLVVAGLVAGRIQDAAPQSCEPMMAELNEILQRSISEIRTVSYVLHPPFLDEGGLGAALRSYLPGFSQRTGIKVDLDFPSDVGRMSHEVELVLFRVIQEALTNVWRHSGSPMARIRVARNRPNGKHPLTVSIEDYGRGIPKNIRRSNLSSAAVAHGVSVGLGLASMRERLNQVGGRLEIDSVPGKTVVRAIVKNV